MSLVQEAGSTAVAQFTVPYKGTWRGVAANQLTPDALYDSMNVFIREGKLRSRPGLLLLNTTIFDNPIIGGAMAVTPLQKIMLALSQTTLYTLVADAAAWQVDTTTSFAHNNDNTIDITFLETMSQYAAIIANVNYPLKRWINGLGAVAIPTAPTAKSVCTAASRIIALVEPHTLRWSSTLTYDTWPALATAKIAQTNDNAICVRSLGNLDFVVYKERSVYIAKAQTGSDASAFNIKFLQRVEGPAGVHAVVDVGGIHFYMTTNGRVGIFDGSTYIKWIADGLWFYLQQDIDTQYASKIVGVFDYRLHTVTFYYPRRFEAGFMTGMLVINLPLDGSGITTYSPFLGVSSKPVSYGYEMRFDKQIDRSLLFTSTVNDCQSMISDQQTDNDDGLTFNCSFQTGLSPLPDMKHYQLNIETFVEREDGYGSVTLNAITSDMLETDSGTESEEAEIVDLNSNPVREYVGFNIPSRFYGLRYSWQSDSKVRYAGATIYGRPLDKPVR